VHEFINGTQLNHRAGAHRPWHPGETDPGQSYGGEEHTVGAQCRPSVYCNHDIAAAGLLRPAPRGAATPGERSGVL
jgi:hypothetical protein